MSKFLHGLLHVLGGALQLVNIAAVPPKYQGLVAAVIALAQGGLAISNHGATNGKGNQQVGS